MTQSFVQYNFHCIFATLKYNINSCMNSYAGVYTPTNIVNREQELFYETTS